MVHPLVWLLAACIGQGWGQTTDGTLSKVGFTADLAVGQTLTVNFNGHNTAKCPVATYGYAVVGIVNYGWSCQDVLTYVSANSSTPYWWMYNIFHWAATGTGAADIALFIDNTALSTAASSENRVMGHQNSATVCAFYAQAGPTGPPYEDPVLCTADALQVDFPSIWTSTTPAFKLFVDTHTTEATAEIDIVYSFPSQNPKTWHLIADINTDAHPVQMFTAVIPASSSCGTLQLFCRGRMFPWDCSSSSITPWLCSNHLFFTAEYIGGVTMNPTSLSCVLETCTEYTLCVFALSPLPTHGDGDLLNALYIDSISFTIQNSSAPDEVCPTQPSYTPGQSDWAAHETLYSVLITVGVILLVELLLLGLVCSIRACKRRRHRQKAEPFELAPLQTAMPPSFAPNLPPPMPPPNYGYPSPPRQPTLSGPASNYDYRPSSSVYPPQAAPYPAQRDSRAQLFF
jgi:hypothetical protein